MNKQNLLSAAQLRERLHYDPKTGVFTWLSRASQNVKAGDIAGNLTKVGYHRIRLNRCNFFTHRLAWLCVHGVWPVADIDHIDGDRANNRIANLRDVSRSVNMENQRLNRSRSGTGFLGVSLSSSKTNPFVAKIQINKKAIHLGSFPTAKIAHEAYLQAKRQMHAGCAI